MQLYSVPCLKRIPIGRYFNHILMHRQHTVIINDNDVIITPNADHVNGMASDIQYVQEKIAGY